MKAREALKLLEKEMGERAVEALEALLATVRSEIRDEISLLRDDLDRRLSGFAEEVRRGFAEVRGEIREARATRLTLLAVAVSSIAVVLGVLGTLVVLVLSR